MGLNIFSCLLIIITPFVLPKVWVEPDDHAGEKIQRAVYTSFIFGIWVIAFIKAIFENFRIRNLLWSILFLIIVGMVGLYSASQGIPQFVIGYMYSTGICVTQNDIKAEKWYKKAADQGHIQARTILDSKKE